MSQVFQEIAAKDHEPLTVGRILAAFGERALGALAFVFAAPLALPMPPGISAVVGLPLIFVCVQMVLGRERLWLPRTIMSRSVEVTAFAAFERKMRPHLQWLERKLRPRLTPVFTGVVERLTGGVCLALALIIFLPIPLVNMAPAFSIALMGLGLIERDGLVLALGWAMAGVSGLILMVMWKWAIAAFSAGAAALGAM